MKVAGPDVHMWFRLIEFGFPRQVIFGFVPTIKDSAVSIIIRLFVNWIPHGEACGASDSAADAIYR